MICQSCRAALLRANTVLRASPPTRNVAAALPRLQQRASTRPSLVPSRTFAATTTSARPANPPISEDENEPASSSMTPTESGIASQLSEALSPTSVLVQDVSGGCGSMYAIDITAERFRGQTMLKQQRMVNAALGDLVKGWHGVQIKTRVPDA